MASSKPNTQKPRRRLVVKRYESLGHHDMRAGSAERLSKSPLSREDVEQHSDPAFQTDTINLQDKAKSIGDEWLARVKGVDLTAHSAPSEQQTTAARAPKPRPLSKTNPIEWMRPSSIERRNKKLNRGNSESECGRRESAVSEPVDNLAAPEMTGLDKTVEVPPQPLNESNEIEMPSSIGRSTQRSLTDHHSQPQPLSTSKDEAASSLPHLTSSSTVHMVSIADKVQSRRFAAACATVCFSNAEIFRAVEGHSIEKGDVLSVARVAGIMGAKRTADIIPLCHPGIALDHVDVACELATPFIHYDESGRPREDRHDKYIGVYELDKANFLKRGIGRFGGVRIVASVGCTNKTGVEMEAMSATVAAALTVVDMCKAMDKGLSIEAIRVVRKEGGKSGTWWSESWDGKKIIVKREKLD